MAILRRTFATLFGPGPGDLVLPRGVINAKVEGTINNSSNTLVTDPTKAFFAQTVHLSHGPVIPPVCLTPRSSRRRSITLARIP